MPEYLQNFFALITDDACELINLHNSSCLLTSNSMNFASNYLLRNNLAVVVAQLVKQSLPTPEAHSSNLFFSKI